ncbi:MAG: electron transport complex subunit RsxC [Candidatus Brocadiaceae bacterium]|jgi:electron transport complex protein RnfC
MATETGKRTFTRGGVHPAGHKGRTSGLPLQSSAPPARVAVLMVQHIGAPAAPAVGKRDEVKKGQMVGEAQGYVSANVHAPVSGTVRAVEKRIYNVTGALVPAVVIENDGEEEWAEGLNEPQDVDSMDADRMVELVQECGVVGLGGATFPAHVKLSPPPDSPVRDVFVNGTECEPYVTVDHRLMLERAADLVDALRLVMRILDAENGWIGIETNKPDAIGSLSDLLQGEPDLRVVPLEVRYPQGAEQQLITAVTGREVPSGGGLPSDVGCLVHNVATMLAIRDAVRFRRPLIERALTVTGDGVEEAGNFIERIGADIGDILRRQGIREGTNQLILGGPMMGIAQGVTDVPLVKGNNALILRQGVSVPAQRDCIRCGRCVEHCPLGLLPGDLSIALEQGDWDAARELNLMECKECGCCAYVCPARRRIVQLVKLGKAELRRRKQREGQ